MECDFNPEKLLVKFDGTPNKKENTPRIMCAEHIRSFSHQVNNLERKTDSLLLTIIDVKEDEKICENLNCLVCGKQKNTKPSNTVIILPTGQSFIHKECRKIFTRKLKKRYNEELDEKAIKNQL